MRAFNLTKALAGEPVTTRHGMPVKELTMFKTAVEPCQLVGTISGAICKWSVGGVYSGACDEEIARDYQLMMASKKRVLWVNLYPSGASTCYATQALADTWTGDTRIGKARRIEIEE